MSETQKRDPSDGEPASDGAFSVARPITESDRRDAVASILKKGGDTVIPDLVAMLFDKSRAVREAVASAFETLPPDPAIRALLPLLAEERSEVRNIVIEILTRIGARSVDTILQTLNSRPDDPDVTLFIIDILGDIGDPVAVGAVVPWLTHAHPNIRNAAVVALGKMGSPAVVNHLRKCFRDEDWICFSAIEALSAIGGQEAEQALLDMLKNDRGDLFDIGCLEGLGASRAIDRASDIFEIMSGRPIETAQRFVETIRRILDGRRYQLKGKKAADALNWLKSIAFSENPWTSYQAIEVLELLGDETATDVLIDLCRENQPEIVRFAAIRAISVVGETNAARTALQTIQAPMEGASSLFVVISDALRRIQERDRERDL
ncbi:MAG: HEAT repeat domain-containing protein [Planctomycetota bacterium]